MSSPMILIGVDIGSQSTKACAVNTEGEVLASSSYSYEICYPKPGWAEEDSKLWWNGVEQTLKNILNKVSPKEVSAVAISGQAPTIIPIDRNGEPLMPAIIWMDSRSKEETKIIQEKIGDKRAFNLSGNRIDPYFGGVKYLWLKRNRPEIYKKTWKICQSHSFPIFKLTGEVVTDYSTAGLCSPIYDYSKRRWSESICEELDLNAELLPKIMSSSGIAGEVTSEASEEVGLKKGTPVIAGGADFATSLLSVGAVEEGDASIILGSACNLVIPMSSPKFDERLLGTMHAVKDTYAVLGGCSAGGILRWMKDQILEAESLQLSDSGTSIYEIMDNKAAQLPIGSEGLIMFPYFNGGLAPIWNPNMRGIYFGLTPKHGKAHLFRAVLEATGYTFLYIASIVAENGIHPKMIYGVNGGTRSKLWCQILSDILDIPIAHVKDNIGAPLGDAILAGVGTGVFKNEKIAKEWIKINEVTYPNKENNSKYKRYYNIYRQLYENTKDLFKLL
jgi:sugar (pentulose or hexulose) kinase